MRFRSALPHLGLVTIAACAVACAPTNAGPHGTSGTAGSSGAAGAQAGAGATGTGPGGTSGGAGNLGPSGSSGSSGSPGSSGSSGTGAAGAPLTDAGAIDNDAAAVVDAGDPLVGWTLTWSDEFNGAAGTKPNPQDWSYDLGGGGWGVSQLQVYTNSAANAATDGQGNLAITAVKDAQGNFTSARIKTQGKFEQAYGRFEIRAKVVTGNGMWPAFWMLGNDFNSAGWPECGEIDIMEIRGTKPQTNLGSLHGPGYSGMHPLTGHDSLPDGGPVLSDDFHTYAVEWETGVVRFYLDDMLYETRTPADIPTDAGASAHWVYDHPFFMLMNVAVGGTFPGPPDGTTFPQAMLVDYVRVYSRANGGG